MADEPTITLPFDQYLTRLAFAHEKGFVSGVRIAVQIIEPAPGSGTASSENVRNAIHKVIAAGLETYLSIRPPTEPLAIGELLHRMIQEGEDAVRTG